MKCLKAFGILLLSCFLFFGLSPLKQVKAASYSQGWYITTSYWGGYSVTYMNYEFLYTVNNGFYKASWQTPGQTFPTIDEAINFANSNYQNFSGTPDRNWTIYSGANYVAYYNLPISLPGNNEWFPEPEPNPTWWEKLKENAQRVIRDIADILGIGSAIDAAIDLDNWLGDLFTVKVGEGELERWQIDVDSPPSPTPTPTPIPYQTVMTPDNNGGFTIQYIYNNPSGTPEVHPQPPANVTNTTNNYGDDFEYPYYENPENKDNPFRLKIPWYLKLILNNNDIPIETLDDHYDVAQYQVQSDDVLEAVDTVYDGFQVIPSDWILLLGAIACLPLFAALIHRMLSG